MAKRIGKAAKIALGAVGAVALSAVGTGVVQFCKWAKDPYSTELWFGFLKKGILITKTDEPGHYKVQTGYRWFDDAAAEEPEEALRQMGYVQADSGWVCQGEGYISTVTLRTGENGWMDQELTVRDGGGEVLLTLPCSRWREVQP